MRPLFFIDNENGTQAAVEDITAEVTEVAEVAAPEQASESLGSLLSYDLGTIMDMLVDGALTLAWKIVVALAIFYVGRWIINRILRLMDKVYERREIDAAIRGFLSSIVKVLLYVAVLLMIVQTIGIDTTSLVAMLASAGLAIGMALSGTLQNFAGGIMILVLKPYRIGDYIEAQGEEGTVTKIGLFTTELHTVDNRVINVPNSSISTSVIDNYSTSEMRRVDWSVTVEYGTDAETVRKVLLDMLNADSRVSQETAPVVFLTEMLERGVVFSARVWTKNDTYWSLKFDMNEKIYTELPKHGIKFAYPKLDVCINKMND